MKTIPSAILFCLLWSVDIAHGADKPEPITFSEAEILIYLMPASQEVRKQGFDVGWDVSRLGDPDQFQFFVFNAKRKCPEGCSVTVGNFSVNRHTAEVTSSDTGAIVTDQELSGVQTILRRAHHLDLWKSN
jgi:hypothetical protein